MKQEFGSLTVGGKAFPQLRGTDGARLEIYADFNPTLIITINKMIPEEKKELTDGKSQFGIFTSGDVMFLLVKYGRLAWMDAPFHAGLYSDRKLVIPEEITERSRIVLNVIILDSSDCTVVRLNHVSISPEMSQKIFEIVGRQLAKPIKMLDYQKQIEIGYRNSTDAMVRKAPCICDGGSD